MNPVLLVLALVALVFCLGGCGSRGEPRVAPTEPHITLEEWRKLPPEERNDPYVLQRLKVATNKK